ncbi:hypothetical protein [Azospirillum sp. SYSU D00513]|uniref:hypothetical protein n=1 Tax=Azospirillum sp. SYSU D00513 TaxID=2812561 RepID=UPI001A9650BB|nr:hypothetical protein [Azospirillum sp. SYSU D00513]
MASSYPDIVAGMNKKSRDPAAATPDVCEVWSKQDDEGQMLVNAIFGFEVAHGRRAKLEDEPEVRERMTALLGKRKVA